jgi:hypothetical protein
MTKKGDLGGNNEVSFWKAPSQMIYREGIHMAKVEDMFLP